MKKILGLLILVLLLGRLATAQDKAAKDCSVLEINSLLDSFKLAKKYSSYIEYASIGAEKAAAQYGKQDSIYAKMLMFLGDGYWRADSVEKGLQYVQEAIAIQKIKTPKSPNYAQSLHTLATINHVKGKYSLAAPLYKEALALRKEILGAKHSDYAATLNNLAVLYKVTGDYAGAVPLYKEALGIWEANDGKNSLNYAGCLTNLAFVYNEIGETKLAEAGYKQAIAIKKELLGNKHAEYAKSLGNLAQLYWTWGDLNLAEPLYKEAIAIKKETLGEKHPEYAAMLSDLTGLYFEMGNRVAAEPLYKQIAEIYKSNFGVKHDGYAVTLNNWANFYSRTHKYELAEPLYKEALQIKKEVLGESHPSYANTLNNLADLYQNMPKYEAAEALFLEAADIRKSVLGEKHPDYILSLHGLAKLYEKMDRDTSAWAYMGQSLSANIGQEISTNINKAWADSLMASNYISTFLITKTLETGYNLLKKSNNAEAKAKQLIVSELVLGILEKERNKFSEEGDKLRSLKMTNNWVLNGLEVLDSEKDAEKAFVFAEQSKSVLLLNAAQTKQAYTFGDLPDTLAQKEKKLQLQKTDLEAKIAENRPKVQIDSLRSLLNDLNLQIKDFKTTIERSYPKYAEIKYEHKGATVADIQKLLPAESALMEYVVGIDATYIFYLDKKQLKISRVGISMDSLKTQAAKLHRCLSNYAEIKENEAKAYADYTEIAHWFYENMLAEPLKNAQNIKHLIIIPDGDLAHLPFETFLRTKADPKGNYSQLAYVVNDFSVSYNYSATLWKQNLAKADRKNNGLMLGIAANYATKLDSSKYDLRLPADQRLRKLLSVLPAAEKEVKMLSESFKGLFAFDNMASEKGFKANASKYSIIHLAMHGLLDNQNPILSSLAFTEDSDSLENNFLHAYEISKMQLNADLVVLSACETGFGKFEQGNGTASLARAFMYAGVPALVVSLWEVNDGSTNILMQAFYKNLSAGMDKAEALRQAKLEYMGISKGISAHPAFWSAFIQLGDSAPIDMHGGGGSGWLFWAIGAAVALGLGAVIWYKRGSSR